MRVFSFPYGTSTQKVLTELDVVKTLSHVRRLVDQGAVKMTKEGGSPILVRNAADLLEIGNVELKVGKFRVDKLLIEEKETSHA